MGYPLMYLLPPCVPSRYTVPRYIISFKKTVIFIQHCLVLHVKCVRKRIQHACRDRKRKTKYQRLPFSFVSSPTQLQDSRSCQGCGLRKRGLYHRCQAGPRSLRARVLPHIQMPLRNVAARRRRQLGDSRSKTNRRLSAKSLNSPRGWAVSPLVNKRRSRTRQSVNFDV